MPEEDRLLLPPTQRPSEQPDLEEETVSIWRLHRGRDALEIRYYESGRARFDAPAGQYPTLYANAERLGSFAEVYGDVGRISPSEGSSRYLSRVYSTRPLKLLALERGETQKALGFDARICVAKRYETTRAWAYAIYRWYPESAGIRYISRHANPHLNYCLFLDRCRSVLFADLKGPLENLPKTVALASARYKLASEIRR